MHRCAIPPPPTASWIAWSTTLTVSSSRAIPCAKSAAARRAHERVPLDAEASLRFLRRRLRNERSADRAFRWRLQNLCLCVPPRRPPHGAVALPYGGTGPGPRPQTTLGEQLPGGVTQNRREPN